ncbi:MAG: tetraacyldisaccharide 4'-kinase [Nitrospirae bacterium]|nr:tetraacyldisaccharide 4'-kinase [Nitrospirota bacterium]
MTPLELLYYTGYVLKKKRSFRLQRRLPYPVISIGNITVGGTGKTPATIAVAEESIRRGFTPVILTRGYKGKAKGPCVVSGRRLPVRNYLGDPRSIIQDVKDAGDEPVLMAETLKGVPVIKSPNRYEGGIFVLQSFSFNASAPLIFILDDGFQHWGLYRDIDIVLVDGLNPFGNRRMLPLGSLREPIKELRRADILVITRQRNEQLAVELRGIWHGKPVYFSEYNVTGARSRTAAEFSLEALRDKRVLAFCGIAHPESFEQTLSSLSVQLAGFKIYRDHHFYTSADVDYLDRLGRSLNCDLFLTTEKDMVKLKTLKIPDTVCSLQMEWNTDAAFYDDVFKRIVAGSK